MSREKKTNAHEPPTATAHQRNATHHDTKQIASQLDTHLDFLADKVLPAAPYLISIPSDVPYRHNPRFVNNWHLATPFAREEEPLQYMSFLTRQDQEDILMKAVGGWSDNQGNLIEDGPSPQRSYGSSANSPIPAVHRKKIAWTDYKAKTSLADSTAKPDEMGEPEKLASNTKAVRMNGVSEKQSNDMAVKLDMAARVPRERKRSFDEVEPSHSILQIPRPEKKPRTRSPFKGHSSKGTVSANGGGSSGGEESSSRKALVPSLISPTLPLSKEADEIPPLLSPTLPSPIEALLLRHWVSHEDTDTVARARSQSAQSPSHTHTRDKSPPSASKKAGLLQKDQESCTSPSLTTTAKDGCKSSPGARGAGSTSSPGPRRRRTIILKYGKRNRKRVEALLKFAPRNKKQVLRRDDVFAADESRDSSVPVVNGAALGRLAGPNGQGKYGPTSHPPKSPQNRRKVPPSALPVVEKATTPIPAAFKSPSLHNSLQARSNLLTPKKELKSTAMRRVESSEGVDVGTPLSNITRQSTPGSIDKSHTSNHNINRPRSPSDPNSVLSHRDENRRAWKAFHTKYHELGRTIKHEGSSLLQQDGNEHEKQGILLSIEALLCFMLSQVAQFPAAHGGDAAWRTMLPYFSLVRRVSKPFPYLYGLTSQLGAVCRQTISRHDLERLSREAIFEDPPSAAAPAATPAAADDIDHGQNSMSATNPYSVKTRRRWQTFRADLTENARELQLLWLEGYHTLGPDILQEHFPNTWRSRATDATTKTIPSLGPGQDPPSLCSLSGTSPSTSKYHLPLDSNTGVIEAVRYARMLLTEWATKEKTTWRCRIEGAML